MKNRILILLVVAATLFACNSDSMTSDGFDETAEKQSPINFNAKKLVGTYEFGSDVNISIPCAPKNLSLNADGAGPVPHLGLTTVSEEWCWTGSPFDESAERYVTFTAANGDELRGKIISIVYPDFPVNFETFIEVVDIDVDNEFGSGTGRFENASGTITQTVVTTPDASQTPTQGFGTFTYSAEGTLKLK